MSFAFYFYFLYDYILLYKQTSPCFIPLCHWAPYNHNTLYSLISRYDIIWIYCAASCEGSCRSLGIITCRVFKASACWSHCMFRVNSPITRHLSALLTEQQRLWSASKGGQTNICRCAVTPLRPHKRPSRHRQPANLLGHFWMCQSSRCR